MPFAPKHPCTFPGCRALISGKGSRCPEHDDSIYGLRVWRNLRDSYIRDHPYCEAPGCRAPATDVDHKIARRDGGLDTYSNLQSLCHRHHSIKTATTDRRAR